MTKVTSQALYKKNIEIKENNKKINESLDDFALPWTSLGVDAV